MRRLGGRGLLLGLAAAAAAAAARWLGWWSDRAGLRLFVPEELARYRGGPGAPGLYLALLGRVYDVSPGRRHYEPGAHYSGFAGRDASRAFVTGDYSEAGLVDDVSDLSFSEVLTLQNWLSFYEKNYELVGRAQAHGCMAAGSCRPAPGGHATPGPLAGSARRIKSLSSVPARKDGARRQRWEERALVPEAPNYSPPRLSPWAP